MHGLDVTRCDVTSRVEFGLMHMCCKLWILSVFVLRFTALSWTSLRVTAEATRLVRWIAVYTYITKHTKHNTPCTTCTPCTTTYSLRLHHGFVLLRLLFLTYFVALGLYLTLGFNRLDSCDNPLWLEMNFIPISVTSSYSYYITLLVNTARAEWWCADRPILNFKFYIFVMFKDLNIYPFKFVLLCACSVYET